jgi:hypothetical protein
VASLCCLTGQVQEHSLVTPEEQDVIVEYAKKVLGIREVLKRDHMKV